MHDQELEVSHWKPCKTKNTRTHNVSILLYILPRTYLVHNHKNLASCYSSYVIFTLQCAASTYWTVFGEQSRQGVKISRLIMEEKVNLIYCHSLIVNSWELHPLALPSSTAHHFSGAMGLQLVPEEQLMPYA